MITSWHWTLSAFCEVTEYLKGNPPNTGGFPSLRASNEELFVSLNELFNKLLKYQWFETPWFSQDGTVMLRSTAHITHFARHLSLVTFETWFMLTIWTTWTSWNIHYVQGWYKWIMCCHSNIIHAKPRQAMYNRCWHGLITDIFLVIGLETNAIISIVYMKMI